MLGLFDSGLGGLSVWQELKNLSSDCGLLYFADTKRAPYGNLTENHLLLFAKQIISHLIDLGATAIAIACHTIATTSTPLLKKMFSLPIFDIASTSLALLENTERFSLLATQATIDSHFYQKAFGKRLESTLACPLFAPMIEKGSTDPHILKTSLKKLSKKQPKIFLACTHFPLIKTAIQSHIPSTELIDPSLPFAKKLLPFTKKTTDKFYVTGNPSHFQKSANSFFPLFSSSVRKVESL